MTREELNNLFPQCSEVAKNNEESVINSLFNMVVNSPDENSIFLGIDMVIANLDEQNRKLRKELLLRDVSNNKPIVLDMSDISQDDIDKFINELRKPGKLGQQ